MATSASSLSSSSHRGASRNVGFPRGTGMIRESLATPEFPSPVGVPAGTRWRDLLRESGPDSALVIVRAPAMFVKTACDVDARPYRISYQLPGLSRPSQSLPSLPML